MIQNKPLLKVSILTSFIIVGFVIASFFPEIVLTLILSVILALFLEPFVKFLEYHTGIKRILAIIIVYIIVGSIVTLLALNLVPAAIEHMKVLYATFHNFPFDQKLQSLSEDLAATIPFINADTIHIEINAIIRYFLDSLTHIAASIAGFVVNLFIIPFITFFILADGQKALKAFIERIPNKYFEMSLNVLYKLERELSAYLKGLFLESSTVGLLNVIALMILDVPYAIAIGILAGIANIVPYLGPIVGASFAIAISFVHGASSSLIAKIIISSIIIRIIDDIILQPLCFGHTLKMHPVAVVLILLIGHQLLGIAGMVIAIPVATILRVSAMETYWGLRHYSITA